MLSKARHGNPNLPSMDKMANFRVLQPAIRVKLFGEKDSKLNNNQGAPSHG
jgi:hypothetical protein